METGKERGKKSFVTEKKKEEEKVEIADQIGTKMKKKKNRRKGNAS